MQKVTEQDPEQKRKIRRTAILLALMVVGFYAAIFIAQSFRSAAG